MLRIVLISHELNRIVGFNVFEHRGAVLAKIGLTKNVHYCNVNIEYILYVAWVFLSLAYPYASLD